VLVGWTRHLHGCLHRKEGELLIFCKNSTIPEGILCAPHHSHPLREFWGGRNFLLVCTWWRKRRFYDARHNPYARWESLTVVLTLNYVVLKRPLCWKQKPHWSRFAIARATRRKLNLGEKESSMYSSRNYTSLFGSGKLAHTCRARGALSLRLSIAPHNPYPKHDHWCTVLPTRRTLKTTYLIYLCAHFRHRLRTISSLDLCAYFCNHTQTVYCF